MGGDDGHDGGAGSRSWWWVPVGLATMALSLVVVLSPIQAEGWDVSVALRTGQHSASRPVIEQDIDDPWLTDDFGHDGQQYYVIARAFPDLASAEGEVDRIRYRARRIVLPVLAAPFPAGEATVWALVGWNVVAIGAIGVAMGVLARRCGVTPWVGLAAALSPGLLESAQGSLADAPAVALALWAVVLVERHARWAAVVLTLAALTRETALAAAAAMVLAGPRRARLAAGAAIAAYGAWVVVVAWWLPESTADGTDPVADALRLFDAPVRTFAAIGWTSAPTVAAGTLLACSLAAAWVLRRKVPILAWWLLLDALMLVSVDEAVSERVANLARVAPLAVPAAALALAVRFAEGPPAAEDPTRADGPPPAEDHDLGAPSG